MNPLGDGARLMVCDLMLGAQRVKFRLEGAVEAGFLAVSSGTSSFSGGPMKRPHRILVVKPDGIGDLVLCIPFLRGLKKAIPGSSITVVVNPAAASLLEHCPYVDEVIPFAHKWSRASRLMGVFRARHLAREGLNGRIPDWAVLPRWGVDYYHASFVVGASGAGRRFGFSNTVSREKKILNPGYDRLLTETVVGGLGIHEVVRNLELLRRMGLKTAGSHLETWVGPRDRQTVDLLWRRWGLGKGRAPVALGVGPVGGRRQWPVERFAKVASWLHRRHRRPVLVLGSAREAGLGEHIRRSTGTFVRDLTGLTNLAQTIAWLARCELFIGNDSGPMHLAAAAGCSVVEISGHPRTGDPEGESSPVRFGPWGVRHRILQPEAGAEICQGACRALYPHCILGVSLKAVQRAADQLLGHQ